MRAAEVDEQIRAGWSALDVDAVRDRVHGALLGTACGDALGAPFEGSADPAAGPLPSDRPGPWHYTDDTAMTLVLAQHLTEQHSRGQGVDEDALVAVFAAEWQGESWRGYGAGPPQIFRAVLAGSPWRQVTDGMYGGSGSFGNGGAMRVAPVALLGRALPVVLDDARRSARVTHAHPLGQAGAALQAAAVALAVSSGTHLSARDGFLPALHAVTDSAELRSQLDRVAGLLDQDDPVRAAESLGHGISALEAVPAAIRAFLHSPDDPGPVLEFAVRMGGDTDTIAAMAGTIAGARCGASAFPDLWRERVENSTGILSLAGRLAVAATG